MFRAVRTPLTGICCGLYSFPCSGVKLLHLPPYSPDFNPIEEGFAAFKAYGKRHGEEFRAALNDDSEVAIEYMNHILENVFTVRNAYGWFRHAGYF